jgi:hypothetical protein
VINKRALLKKLQKLQHLRDKFRYPDKILKLSFTRLSDISFHELFFYIKIPEKKVIVINGLSKERNLQDAQIHRGPARSGGHRPSWPATKLSLYLGLPKESQFSPKRAREKPELP